MRYTYTTGDRPLEGFTIRRALGRGGFGEVYQAVSDGGKVVALKHVQRHLDVELRGVAHCLNVKHPNLVELFDIKQTPGEDHWVVMEYMDGDSLDRVIAQHPDGMPEDLMLRWLRGLCEGVRCLHERGIVHRDLKPGNVFMGQEVVKLGDYGLSKFISASRRSGHTGSIGTVHYMAPEVAQGRYGKEIDLYSIGVILYEMLTGRLPFDGETAGEILMKHLTAAPDVSELPMPYRTVVARLLEKDPQRRYPSVDAMLADLGICLDQPPVYGEADAGRIPTVLPGHPALPPTEAYARQRNVAAAAPMPGWMRLVIALPVAGVTATGCGIFAEVGLRLRDGTPAIAIGAGLLAFMGLLAVLRRSPRVAYIPLGRSARRVLGRLPIPWPVRMLFALILGVGSAMFVGAMVAGITRAEGLAAFMGMALGVAVFLTTALLLSPVKEGASAKIAAVPLFQGSWFRRTLQMLLVSLGVALLVGGFFAGIMRRHEELGVLIGLASGLLTCTLLGVYLRLRVMTGLTVALLSAVSVSMAAGAGLTELFRSDDVAVLAAFGIGMVTFTVTLLVWYQLLDGVSRSLRSRYPSLLGRPLEARPRRA